MDTAYRKGIVLFNNPLKEQRNITICGAQFPNSGGSKYGKIVVREQEYSGKPGYTWQWEGEDSDLCKNDRYNFSDMVIALRTDKEGKKRELRDLVTKLELYKSGDTSSIEIKGDQLSNAIKGNGTCVNPGVIKGTQQTNWSAVGDNKFSKLFRSKLNLKSVQCKSGTSAEIEVYYRSDLTT